MADSISSPSLTTDPTTLIPTYGLWCGPNWSAGQRDNTMIHDQLENSPVQSATMTCHYTDAAHENLVCVVSGKTTTVQTSGTSETVDVKGNGYEEQDTVSSTGATTSTITGNGDVTVLNSATATISGESNTSMLARRAM